MSVSTVRVSRAQIMGALIVSAAILAWPGTSNGQIVGRRRVGAGAPPRPAPLPPQPAAIRNDLRYRFSKFSMEGYSLYDFVQTSRYVTDSGTASFAQQGVGLRLDWRIRPLVSLTGDMTQSFLGGPFYTQTVALGTRVHPDRLEYKVRPFFDLRGSWAHTYDTYAVPLDNTFTVAPPTLQYNGGRVRSNGFGGYVGTGMDYGVTRTLAITTEVGGAWHHLGDATLSGRRLGSQFDYNATTVRFIVGLKYTGGSYVTMDPPMSKQK